MYIVEKTTKEEGIFPKSGCRHKGRQHGLSWYQETRSKYDNIGKKLPARGIAILDRNI